MNYLLDTHVFIWWMTDDSKLSHKIKDLISSQDNTIYYSTVVVWEIIIKKKLGKMEVPYDLRDPFHFGYFNPLNITFEHAFEVENLPLIHHDPFDRMLIAQARQENLTILTHDQKIIKYDVSFILA